MKEAAMAPSEGTAISMGQVSLLTVQKISVIHCRALLLVAQHLAWVPWRSMGWECPVRLVPWTGLLHGPSMSGIG